MEETLQTLGICVGAAALVAIAISVMSIATNISRFFGGFLLPEDIEDEWAETDGEPGSETRPDQKNRGLPAVPRPKRARRKQRGADSDGDNLH